MTTTHLFVELLVIGFGALLFIFLFAAALLGYEPAPLVAGINKILSGYALVPLFPIVYVLGILADRLADHLFDRSDKKHRRQVFGEDVENYFHSRRTLVENAPNLWEHIEYLRSRLRICRGWALNASMLFLALVLYAVRLAVINHHYLDPALTAGALAFLGALAYLCFWSWKGLNLSEYKKIQRQARWVQRSKK